MSASDIFYLELQKLRSIYASNNTAQLGHRQPSEGVSTRADQRLVQA